MEGTIATSVLTVGVVVALLMMLFFMEYFRLIKHNARLLADEKNRAERALAEAQQASLAKTEFLSRMSHEIRTPMNGIMGMTAIALENIGNDAKVRECLEKVTLSSEHLLSLINDILDMSKIESGKVEIKNEKFNLSTFIGSLAAVFRAQAAEHGVIFDIVVEGCMPPWVVGDPLRLNQIIYNLMGNAFKFTPVGGCITLRIKRLKSCDVNLVKLRIAVEDTGRGIDPAHLEKIFNSFDQGDADTGRKYGGTGLGLAITKRFVELMGGHIRVSSVVDHGSCFAVEVPLGRGTEEEDMTGEVFLRPRMSRVSFSSGAEQCFCGLHVLVAEDNALNQEIAIELMSMAGAQVDAVSTGREALERFTASCEGYYDLVLMDVQMPELNGYEATAAIRALNRVDARKVIILAMTANAFTEDERRSLESGMDGHLSKPLDIRCVYATINEFLKAQHHELKEATVMHA